MEPLAMPADIRPLWVLATAGMNPCEADPFTCPSMVLRIAMVLLAFRALSWAVEPPAELEAAMRARDSLAQAISNRLLASDPRVQAWAA